jgi:hypothetical protein
MPGIKLAFDFAVPVVPPVPLKKSRRGPAFEKENV